MRPVVTFSLVLAWLLWLASVWHEMESLMVDLGETYRASCVRPIVSSYLGE